MQITIQMYYYNCFVVFVVKFCWLNDICGHAVSQTWVCDRWFVGIAGSNPTVDIDACRL